LILQIWNDVTQHEFFGNQASRAAKALNLLGRGWADFEKMSGKCGTWGRPFPVAAEPDGKAYRDYGVEKSFWRKLKAILLRLPTALRGLCEVGLAGLNTNDILPADFLIDERGRIVEAYYGADAGDHIPLERIECFLAGSRRTRTAVGPVIL